VHVLVFYPLLNWKMHGETMKFNKYMFINMFNHVLLFFSNMFRSLMWPSSGCLITRIQSVLLHQVVLSDSFVQEWPKYVNEKYLIWLHCFTIIFILIVFLLWDTLMMVAGVIETSNNTWLNMFINLHLLVCHISKQLSFMHGHGPHKNGVAFWLIMNSDYWIEFPPNACVTTVRINSKITELLQKFGRKKLFIYGFRRFITGSTKSFVSKIKSPKSFFYPRFPT